MRQPERLLSKLERFTSVVETVTENNPKIKET